MIYHFNTYRKIITQRRDYETVRTKIRRFEKVMRIIFIVFFVSTNILSLSIMITEGVQKCEYVDKTKDTPTEGHKKTSI
jgi:hypothetical protein